MTTFAALLGSLTSLPPQPWHTNDDADLRQEARSKWCVLEAVHLFRLVRGVRADAAARAHAPRSIHELRRQGCSGSEDELLSMAATLEAISYTQAPSREAYVIMAAVSAAAGASVAKEGYAAGYAAGFASEQAGGDGSATPSDDEDDDDSDMPPPSPPPPPARSSAASVDASTQLSYSVHLRFEAQPPSHEVRVARPHARGRQP